MEAVPGLIINKNVYTLRIAYTCASHGLHLFLMLDMADFEYNTWSNYDLTAIFLYLLNEITAALD